MEIASASPPRSRAPHWVAFTAILILMLAISPRLRVYFNATLVVVTVDRISPDGTRTTIATPDEFKRVGAGTWSGTTLVEHLRKMVNGYMQASALGRDASPGDRFEWTVRWSENALCLDQSDRIVWEAPDGIVR